MEFRLGPTLVVAILLVSGLSGCLGASDGSTQDGDPTTAPPDGNQAPTAFFTFECHHLDCTFDGSRSDDADGTIASYRWDFGDGTTAKGELVDHTYAQGGEYTVVLTVRDDNGGEDTSKREIPVQAAPPDHSHGTDGDDTEPEKNTLPDDYHARHEGPVTPTFEANWTAPVNDSRASLVHVKFNVTSETLPAGVAQNVTVNLTDPTGQQVRRDSVDTQNPEVEWNVTEGTGIVGSWTIHAQGNGLGDEDLEGTSYVLLVDVYYGTGP